jgi:uncharacterized ubiquitin-like protein YukD
MCICVYVFYMDYLLSGVCPKISYVRIKITFQLTLYMISLLDKKVSLKSVTFKRLEAIFDVMTIFSFLKNESIRVMNKYLRDIFTDFGIY